MTGFYIYMYMCIKFPFDNWITFKYDKKVWYRLIICDEPIKKNSHPNCNIYTFYVDILSQPSVSWLLQSSWYLCTHKLFSHQGMFICFRICVFIYKDSYILYIYIIYKHENEKKEYFFFRYIFFIIFLIFISANLFSPLHKVLYLIFQVEGPKNQDQKVGETVSKAKKN
jgi:hypothetical protein